MSAMMQIGSHLKFWSLTPLGILLHRNFLLLGFLLYYCFHGFWGQAPSFAYHILQTMQPALFIKEIVHYYKFDSKMFGITWFL